MLEHLVARCELKFLGSEVATEAGTFNGYAAIFGNEDAFGDLIAKGAFKASLKIWQKLGKWPPMLLQHGGGFFGGSASDLVPIGKWEDMREEEAGLAVNGRLFALETELGERVYTAMREQVLDGLSIGYRTRKFDQGTKPGEPARTLKEVELVEVSLVTFPANDRARISQVKAGAEMSEREFEAFLREVGGFSRSEAKTIIARGFRGWAREATEQAGLAAFVDACLAAEAALKGASAHGTE